MTSPTGTDGNTLWEQGLINVLAAKPMDRNQFLGMPWISLVDVHRDSYRKSPWNYPMPKLDTQEFYLYKKSAPPAAASSYSTLGGFIILVGKLDWFLQYSGGPSPRDHYWNEFVTNSVDLVFHPPNPLPLDPSTFDTAAETMYNAAMWLETAANRLQNEADLVKSGPSGFQGDAADAFVQVIDNMRDEMRMLREDLNTNQDWVAMLHDNATAARSFWQGLQDAWTRFSQGKDPSGMLSDVMRQMEEQVDALNRTQGSSPNYWTGSVTDPWPFTLDFGAGPRQYDLSNPGALGVLNQDMQTFFIQQLQVLDQTLQAQLSRLRNSQDTTRSNIHDIRQYVPPNSPTGNGGGGGDNLPNTPPPGGGGGDNVPNTPPPGGGGGDNVPNTPPPSGGGGGGNLDFAPPPNGGGNLPNTPPPTGGGGGGNLDFASPPNGGGGGGNLDFASPPNGGGGGGNLDFASPPNGGGGGGNLDFASPPGGGGGGGSLGDPSGGGGNSLLGLPPPGGGTLGGGSFPAPGSRPPVRTGNQPDGGVGLPDLPTSIDPSTVDPGSASGDNRPGAGALFPDNALHVPGGPNVPGGSDGSGLGASFLGGPAHVPGSGPDPGAPIPGLRVDSGGTDGGGSGFDRSGDGQFGGGVTNTVQSPNGFRMGPAPAVPGSEGTLGGGLGPGGGVLSSVGGPSDGVTTPGPGGMPPFYPPMGGGMGGGAAGNERERERKTWLDEDEDVWGTDPDVVPAVIGRDDTEEYVEDDRSVRRPVPPAPAPAPGGPARSGGHTSGRGY